MTQYTLSKSKRSLFYIFKLITIAALLIPMTSCGLFILAVGGVETDVSSHPAFEHLFDRTFEFRKDVFVYKYPYGHRSNVISIGLPGYNSDMPKTVDDYKNNPEKYEYILGLINQGTSFIVNKIALEHYPSGSSFVTVFITLDGYDFANNRIDAHQLYTGYSDIPGTLKADWVQPVD